METFLDYCKNYILDNIDDFEGRECYASDFPFKITDGANVDGSLIYDRLTAMKYLQEWWWDCAGFYDENYVIEYAATNLGMKKEDFQ